jgi:transposase-like protein
MSKHCIFCNSTEVIKKGKQSSRQKYYCKNCNKNFQSKAQNSRKIASVINDLTFKKTIQI